MFHPRLTANHNGCRSRTPVISIEETRMPAFGHVYSRTHFSQTYHIVAAMAAQENETAAASSLSLFHTYKT